MNVFSSFASSLARGREFTNNPLYIEEYNYPIDVDNSGGSGFIDYSNNVVFHPHSHSIKDNTFTLIKNESNTSGTDLTVLSQRRNEFALMCKFRVLDDASTTKPLFGFENPFYELSVNNPTVHYGGTVSFTILKVSPQNINYTIAGVTSADINGASLTGTIQQVETIITLNVVGGTGPLVFSLDGLSMSESVTIDTSPASNTHYKVALNTDASTAPYYIFTAEADSTTGTPTLQKGNTYTFTRTDGGHPFNIGDAHKQNNTGIVVSSTGTSTAYIINGAESIETGESLTFTIPANYSGILKYYCSAHPSMIADFTIQ